MSTLWGIACFFNPAGFSLPLDNLRVFSERARRQGLPLVIVELAIGNADFALDESMCERLVRLRTDEVLWHKEALLNVALKHLPEDCDRVCWLDTDILFDNEHWVRETREALDRHKVVQPFSHCTWLPPKVHAVDPELTIYPAMHDEYNRCHGFGFGWRHFGRPALEARILYGHVGFAWAARRDVIESIGFYDTDIYAGTGDNFMAHAFVGHHTMMRVDGALYASGMIRHYEAWAREAYRQVEGDVSYVDGNLNHLWHGSSAHRRYLERVLLLRETDFDPARHLVRSQNGLYRLNQAPEKLTAAVQAYFRSRMEDTIPRNAGVCAFGDGFYADEGGFRWAQRSAELRIVRPCDNWSFEVSSNVINTARVEQRIDIFRNDTPFKKLLLRDNGKVPVHVGPVDANERFTFLSDFDFRPADSGSSDTRCLSFMFW